MSLSFPHRLIVGLVVGAVCLMSSRAPAGDVVIIVNKQVPDAVMTDADVQDIFLGKKTRWSDGIGITFVTHQDNDTHSSFLRRYVGRTNAQFNNHWKREVFTGKGRMPRSIADDRRMVDFVMNTEGAIGYVSSGAATDVVRVVTIK